MLRLEPGNVDEAKVPFYRLPDPLLKADGQPVSDAATWRKRRAEILDLFQSHVYGRTPIAGMQIQATVTPCDPAALSGWAIRKEVCLHFSTGLGGSSMDLLIYRPAEATGPAPRTSALSW
jgi:hypothetical protein